MKACLIFVRTTVFEDPMVFAPLGLFSIRAVLEENGHVVEYIDMSEYERADDGTKIDRYPNVSSLPLSHDVYFISGTSPQAQEIRKVAKYLKGQGKSVIVGGPHATNYAGGATPLLGIPTVSDLPVDRELVENTHVLVKYEGEGAVLEAIKRLEEGHRSMARHGRGIVIQQPNIDDLGTIPIPNRDAALKYYYYLEDELGGKYRGTTMFSSRGCPEECRFCDSPGLWGRKVRYTPLNKVIEEFEQIKALGFGAIHFFDDILPLHKGRMIDISRNLKAREFIWRCFFRVDIISQYGKDFLKMMHASGLREALVGVESGSQELLDTIHKNTTVEQNTVVRQWCREVGIRFKASVILGLPGESWETMEMTKRWVLENRPDKVNLCIFIPFTGTPIAKSTEASRRRVYGKEDPEYDISWEMDAASLEQHFYAGGWDTLKALISTSHVSSAQIEDFYHGFIADLTRAGISY